MARFDLTDTEWSIIAPLLLGFEGKKNGRPRPDDRKVLNGIFFVLRTGTPWRDLPDPDTGTITKKRQKIVRDVMKSDASARAIALPAPMIELLREQKARVLAMALKWGKGYQRDPLFVFPGVAGEAAQPQNLLHRMRKVMRRAKVVGPSPCRAWRHTSATQLLDSGQNIKTVQRRLGHASLSSTMIYLHAVDERDTEAADNLGALLIGSGTGEA